MLELRASEVAAGGYQAVDGIRAHAEFVCRIVLNIPAMLRAWC